MEIVLYVLYGVLVSLFGWYDVPQMSRDIDSLNDTVKRIEKTIKDMDSLEKKITAEKRVKHEQNT